MVIIKFITIIFIRSFVINANLEKHGLYRDDVCGCSVPSRHSDDAADDKEEEEAADEGLDLRIVPVVRPSNLSYTLLTGVTSEPDVRDASYR